MFLVYLVIGALQMFFDDDDDDDIVQKRTRQASGCVQFHVASVQNMYAYVHCHSVQITHVQYLKCSKVKTNYP